MDGLQEHNWARPSADHARQLMEKTLRELGASFIDIADVCGYTSRDILAVFRQNFIINSDPALFFLAHESLLQALKENDLPACVDIFDALYEQCLHIVQRPSSVRYSRYGLTYSSPIEILMKSELERQYSGLSEECRAPQCSFYTPDVDESQRTVDMANEIQRWCLRADLEHFTEIKTLIKRIVLVGASDVEATCYVNIVGAVFMRTYEPSKEHWSRVFEQVVCESAYNLLCHLWFHSAPIADETRTSLSSFRASLSPLSKVYRTMFVSARAIYGCEALFNNALLQPEDVDSHYYSTPLKETFAQSVRVLESSGKLTRFGWQLLANCKALVNACRCPL